MAVRNPEIITVKRQVYKIIRDNICNGTYPPGSRLQEIELSKKLGVSRSPVREALKQLVSEGLTDEFPNKGVFVKNYSPKDICDILDMRLLLESYSILHARTVSAAEQKQFKGIIASLEKTYKSNDLNTYIRYDTMLHEKFVDLCGNNLLREMYGRTYMQIMQFRVYSLTSEKRFEESVTEHRGIVENILSGNLKKAVQIDETHLTRAKDSIIRYLKTE
jgi:DNA-binding GntR family transcriptional regulator